MDSHANSSRTATFVLRWAIVPLLCFVFMIKATSHAQKQANNDGSFAVGVVLRSFVDQERSNWQGTGPRPLATIIWYPATSGAKLKAPDFLDPQMQKYFVSYPLAENASLSGEQNKYPLVVLSHGNTSLALSLDWLGYFLASHGYIVAAVNHHGNTAAEPGGPIPQGFGAVWERPKDISVLIDRMLSDPFFGSHIDSDRIGAAGHSLGGATVLELAGAIFDPDQLQAFCKTGVADPNCDPPPMIRNQLKEFSELAKTDPALEASIRRSHYPYYDHRVKSVFAMAPAIGLEHTDASLRAIQIPAYIVAGRADDITPVGTNAERFANLIPTATLTILPGMVGHATFGSQCTPVGVKDAGWICHDENEVDRALVHKEVDQLALSFFQSTLETK